MSRTERELVLTVCFSRDRPEAVAGAVMPAPGPAEKPTPSREENRRKAMAGVQAIFDRYG